ncbi:NAD(P)H-dependent glycerol-3-phosphate dehydrogenase [Sneathiella limimaris]|uniref:NAD(P)H-dependent glycerol-3-phosphate dehydrogenase n=1 Tax=Sneathiella limimaris TaxID=1964213 RepID=UPI00146AC033|nr:NAD(P)H-dependent glycerol-3-phosphate dehydrogenase [Sneathiella limimaris]
MSLQRISVLGAGAWGTALAISIAQKGDKVCLWSRRTELAAKLTGERENKTYLPGIPFPETLEVTHDLKSAVDADIILNVTPAQHLRQNLEQLRQFLKEDVPLIICSKGVESQTGNLMSEVMETSLPGQPYAILSGPNFASEVARGLPSATTLATQDEQLGLSLAKAIGKSTFRPYVTTDVIGAQMGGAIKNVLAIACGIVAGANLGENARAALITRGMAEILRLGEKMGGRAETLMGLSGLGDLVLTCSSTSSRNFSLGEALGRGEKLQDILERRVTVTEGVHTAAALSKLSADLKIEMPICQAVHKLLNGGATVTEMVEELLARPFRDEKLAGFD